MTDVPGQLNLVPDDLDDRAAQLRVELDQLEALRTEGILRSLSRVSSAGDLHHRAGADLDQAVAQAHAAGATWQQIADALGIRRQSAWRRWGREA